MIANLSKTTISALFAGLLLAGCVSSTDPLMTGAEPVLGPTVRAQFYDISGERADGPQLGMFRWEGGEYRALNKEELGIASFTIYPLAGNDFIIQSRSAKAESKHIEYGLARKIANSVYVIGDIDEDAVDEATRKKLCPAGQYICQVANRDDLLVLARASAAKPELKGSLAILVAEKP
jgi:hypothetical protein